MDFAHAEFVPVDFVTSKLADHHKSPGFIATAVEAQLKALNLEYIDLPLALKTYRGLLCFFGNEK